MRAPEFAAYVAPARLYPELWRLLLGILLILFCYLGGTALVLVALYPIITAQDPFGYFGWILDLATPDKPGQVIALLLTFGGLALGPIVAAGTCHLRPAGTLFGPRGEALRGFGLTLLVLAPVYAALVAVNWLIDAPVPNMEPAQWLRFLPLALPLLLLQVSAEELLFRGYLQQQLAARFAARWVWMGLPAIVFASLHYNPEAGSNTWLIIATTFAFALIAADLTEQSGSLGAAIGLHFVNNFTSLLLVSVKGTITGLALFITPYDITEASMLSIGLLLDIALLLLIWRLLRFVLCR